MLFVCRSCRTNSRPKKKPSLFGRNTHRLIYAPFPTQIQPSRFPLFFCELCFCKRLALTPAHNCKEKQTHTHLCYLCIPSKVGEKLGGGYVSSHTRKMCDSSHSGRRSNPSLTDELAFFQFSCQTEGPWARFGPFEDFNLANKTSHMYMMKNTDQTCKLTK